MKGSRNDFVRGKLRVFQFFFFCVLMVQCTANDDDDQNDMVNYLKENSFLQGKAEIVFLLDRSGSVGARNFEIEKGFVESFLTHIVVDVNASRVAVISYSNTADLHIDYLREPQTKCFLSQELQNVIFTDSRATNIAAALDMAGIVFINARPNVKKVVVLISDGSANVGGDPVPHAERLKQTGVQIFGFGIGKVLQSEMELLASSKQHVYSCAEFKDFNKLAKKIRGDPHESSWSGHASTPNCDHLCNSPYKNEPDDPGCCDHHGRCSCALLSGMHTCLCGPGYYGLSGLAGDCRPCPIGSYKSHSAPAKKCTLCPSGSTTVSVGSARLRDCVCKDGYQGDPSKGINCTMIKCPLLQTPTHGYMLSCDNSYWSECVFMCEDGYELVDKNSDIRTCQKDGTWSGKTTRCQHIRCPSPKQLQFGYTLCDGGALTVGKKCRFACYRGYIMDGPKERECLPTKRWSGTKVNCIPVECELPPTLKYGQIYGCNTNVKTKYGETCAFRCNQGFDLDGSSYLTCAENGKLKEIMYITGRNPSCIDMQPPEISCPVPWPVRAEKGKNGATVHWNIPQPTDNSGIPPKLRAQPPIYPPAFLKIGRTTIDYTAIDHVGRESSCRFQIEIYDDEPPNVLKCPTTIEVSSDDVEEPAYWEEPEFQDNSGFPVRIRKSHEPGALFTAGRHIVTYEAYDEYNNRAECVFDVIMTRNTCPYYPAPANGAFTCDDWLYGQICQAFCNERYDFVEQPAQYYVCNADSEWVTMPDSMRIPWPDCTRPALPEKIRHMMKGFYYRGDCNDPSVQRQIKKMLLTHLLTEFERSTICFKAGTCTLDTVRVMCGKTTDHMLPKRFRRDVWEHARREELELEFEITINADQELNDTEGVLENFLETIQKLKWDVEEDFTLEPATKSPNAANIVSDGSGGDAGTVVITEGRTEMICKPGSVLNENLCAPCAQGTYFDVSMQACVDCPIGQYQEEEGQLKCDNCPEGMSTEHRRSRNQTDCKGICRMGTYSSNGLETCLACPVGTYQDRVGQNTCDTCPGETTTAGVHSATKAECKDVCEPGFYSESGLQPCESCPIGYYQPIYNQKVCVECPNNFSTTAHGSMNSSDCTDIDPCAAQDVCLYGGECKRIGRDATCNCSEGFEGDRCEKDIDECKDMPCFNGGYCYNAEGSYYCNCTSGFMGPLCEMEVNECSSAPCMNNGTCLDKVDDYACVCPVGFEGSRCEIALELCSHDIICVNAGVCVQMEGFNESSVCDCRAGYAGVDCSVDIDECEETTCYNNGSCIDGIASYQCACAFGYTGTSCETEVDECESNECATGSTCKDLIGSYECVCPPGWSGTFCESKLDDNFVLNFPEAEATIANMATMTLNSALSDVTVSMWVQTTDVQHMGTPLSYAVATTSTTDGDGTVVDNALTISDCSEIHVYVNNEPLATEVQVADGQWHHLAFTWSSENMGEWALYKDGELQTKGTNLRPKETVSGGGTMVIGQEQDTVGGGFSSIETFTGNITRVNVWNSFFSKNNITRLCQLDDDIPGKVVAWPDFLQGLSLIHI